MVSLGLPCVDLGNEAVAAFDATIETLAFEHADLDLNHVEPAGVFGRVVEVEPPELAPRPTISTNANGSGFCSIARRHGVRIRGSRRDCATPNCASKPAPKMSIIEARAASIGPCSKSSSRGIGLRPTKTWPSLARPASANDGSLQRLATRPAAIIARRSITASQSSSKISPWRAAMAVIRASCVRSAAPTFSFSTIGVSSPSMRAPA